MDPARAVRKPVHERWSSPWMFILAAGGAAIGFNNFWQFPSLVAQFGGGAFLIVYLLCVLLIGLPLMMTELMLGRMGRGSPISVFRDLASRVRADRNWAVVGWVGVLSVFLILSYLSVIAGWTIAYTLRSASGVFIGLTADGLNGQFAQLVKDPEKQLFWHTFFMTATMVAAGNGVRHGVEKVIRYVMPLLAGMLAILLAYAATTDGFAQAAELLFMPDFTKLSGLGVLSAMGHAFFSLGLGAGAMLMYGAYLGSGTQIPRLSLYVVGFDTLVGIVASLIIFSVLFAGGVDLTSGPTLVFQSLPLAFDHLPYGQFFATVFFALLVTVAWVSAIALAEPVMAWFGERFAMSALKSALVCGIAAWALGLVSMLSFSSWAFSFKLLGAVKKLGFFDILQAVTAQVLLPLSGILIALFAGWVLKPDTTRGELALDSPCLHDAWLWLMRVVIPVLLVIVLISLPLLFA